MQITNRNKENTEEIPVTVFRKETETGRTIYTIGISRKKIDGTYERGYVLAQFNKDVSIENMTKIRLENAILDFYKDKNGQTVTFIRVFDYKLFEENNIKEETKEEEKEHYITLSDDDMRELPF